jgi:hypothetical protein
LVLELELEHVQQQNATANSTTWEEISRPESMSVTLTMIRFFSSGLSAIVSLPLLLLSILHQ